MQMMALIEADGRVSDCNLGKLEDAMQKLACERIMKAKLPVLTGLSGEPISVIRTVIIALQAE